MYTWHCPRPWGCSNEQNKAPAFVEEELVQRCKQTYVHYTRTAVGMIRIDMGIAPLCIWVSYVSAWTRTWTETW